MRLYPWFFLPLMGTSMISARDWVDPTPDALTSFVYAPGVLASEILMSRYCPTFVASTGQQVSCSKGIEVIRLPATSTNLSEISLKQLNHKELKKKKKQRRVHKKNFKNTVVGFFVAPFRAIWYTLSYLSNFIFGYTISKPAVKQECPGESLHMYWADPLKVNLGQEEDLELFSKAYDKHVQAQKAKGFTQNNIILYGTSRGSATVFNFAALRKPKEVKAIVCEGLFDSISHVYETTRSSRIRMLIKLLYKVGNFKEDGILPIKLVDQIPHDIPILLITSHSDIVVPYECTMTIYKTLREKGHNKVHILALNKATHAWYPYCSKEERTLYESVVHAFYKEYGLPYIEEYAELGHTYFGTMTKPVLYPTH